jgi:hypothetical protein
VHVLDYVYIEGTSDPNGRPGMSTLSFNLDEHGVTPITIQSRVDGLRIIKDSRGHGRLEVNLSAVPPREDITLVASRVPTRGTFDDLPEGSEIRAQFQGRTYKWQLTYRGGAGGHDLVLKNRSDFADDAPVTHIRGIPEPPAPLWPRENLHFPARKGSALLLPGAVGAGRCTSTT